MMIDEMTSTYIQKFIEALMCKATPKSHTNVMLHLLGYIKKQASARDKQKVLLMIEEYRQGLVPLIVPLSLLKHFLETHGSDYVNGQAYLSPYPEQLGLRNGI